MSPSIRAHWPWVFAIAITGLSLTPLLMWLEAPVHRPQDEGLLLVYPELILNGQLPHRDFLASYPPGNFLFLAALYELFGVSITTERLVGFFYRAALVFGVFRLTAIRGPSVATTCAVGAAMLLLPLRLEAFSWVGGLAALLWGLDALIRERPRLAALLLAITVSYRLDLLPATIAAAFLILRFAYAERPAVGRTLWGTLLLLSLLALPLFVLTSPQNMLQDLVLDPIFYSGPARRLPIASLGTDSLRLLALLSFSTVAVILVLWVERHHEPTQRVHGVALATLSVGLLPQALQRLDADHLLYALALTGGVLPSALDRVLAGPLRRPSRLAISAAILFTCTGTPILALGVALWHDRHAPDARVRIHRNERSLPSRGEHEIVAFSQLGALLHEASTPGERLFIGPLDLSQTHYSDLHLYHLFPDLPPASYYLEMNPNSANQHGTRLSEDLAQADWLLLSDEWNQPGQWLSDEPGDSRPNRIVGTHFTELARVGVWHLYQHQRHNPNTTPSLGQD